MELQIVLEEYEHFPKLLGVMSVIPNDFGEALTEGLFRGQALYTLSGGFQKQPKMTVKLS
jgi:hypothetical protein